MAKLLLRLTGPHWASALLSLGLSLLLAASTVGFAWLAGQLVGVVAGDPAADGGLLAGFFVAAGVARAIATYANTVVVTRLGSDLGFRLRAAVYDGLLLARPRGLVRAQGEMQARTIRDVADVEFAVTGGALPLLAQGLTCLALFAFAVRTDVRLALLGCAGVVIAGLALRGLQARVGAAHRSLAAAYGRLSERVAETAQQLPVIQTFEAENSARALFAQDAHVIQREALRTARLAALPGAAVGAGIPIAAAAVLWLGPGVAAALGGNGADLVSLGAAFTLALRPFVAIARSAMVLSAGAAALERIGDLVSFNAPPAPAAGGVEAAPLRASGLAFAHGSGGDPVIRNLDLLLHPGEAVAIVGESGAGKSTLVGLLLGHLRPSAGTIEIGDNASHELPMAVWRRHFSWVPQEPSLLAATVLENIALSGEHVDRARAEHAARAAGIHDRIARLPAGYDTLLGPQACGLSAGEQQRICIARALYREAPILILDEPTASLDEEAEAVVAELIESLANRRSLIVISHRAQTIRGVPRVLSLEGGRLTGPVRVGSRASLPA